MTIRQTRRSGVLVAVLFALSSGGCSSTPDAVNPVEWYKGARDWIGGEDKVDAAQQAKVKQAEAKPVPGADKPFPKLETVPDRPPQSSAAERERMANSLLADRDRARYSNEQIRRQNSSIASESLPQAASATPVPAPPAQAPTRSNPVVTRPENSSISAVPPRNPAPRTPVVQNQPVQVVPNQPIQSSGPPVPSQPVQMPAVPSASPPPPPIIVGSNISPADTAPGIPVRPPDVNPSGGGPGFPPLMPPPQQAEIISEADRSVPRFSNGAGLQQPPIYEPPAFETTQAVRANTPPVATILFGDGSARIGRGDRQVIRQVYGEYRRRGGRIHVIGHASSRTRNLDQTSHQLANFSISYERARAVAGMLERLGVPPESIVLTAMSDQEPTYFEVMPAGEAGNRRVEIFLEN